MLDIIIVLYLLQLSQPFIYYFYILINAHIINVTSVDQIGS